MESAVLSLSERLIATTDNLFFLNLTWLQAHLAVRQLKIGVNYINQHVFLTMTIGTPKKTRTQQ